MRFSSKERPVYTFAGFRLDPEERRLTGEGGEVALTPKAFDTLVFLVEHDGRLVTRDELLERIWSGTHVGENTLAQNISTLRKALGADGELLIQTVPKRGYRFCGAVAQPRVARGEELPRERSPETKYARSGDVNIAYQVIGDGAFDLVFVMGWVSHLDYFWREPSFARFLLRLSSFARLILFDKRGTGLSDRVPNNELPTLEQRMDDVRAVMDAVGSRRAALCGVSEGGPMCSLFAATYPERTLALVMIGTYAKRIRDTDYPWGPTAEQRQRFFDEIRAHWGGPLGIEERAPSMAHDPVFREWWATYLRMGASPGAALALTQMNAEIDVRQVLPSIRVPTLVIHRTGDRCLTVEEGRYVAGRIPGAKYVELPGADHLPFAGDQDAILTRIEEFLTGVSHAPEPDTVLATVLVLLGDVPVTKELEWFRGRAIETTSGRTIAIFDGPARAIRCAVAIVQRAPVRAGLHTGECEVGAADGITFETCMRIAAAAATAEVLVSSTVKDLVAGSGIRFEERRMSGEWRVFAVTLERRPLSPSTA
ncbi:MAG TPA: alpha/beta fold hydrolase [Thermoanaerobaculia bacterium]|nr:alpha/beta fold hydrolase [Thermoanaerobaculia bacterium]